MSYLSTSLGFELSVQPPMLFPNPGMLLENNGRWYGWGGIAKEVYHLSSTDHTQLLHFGGSHTARAAKLP